MDPQLRQARANLAGLTPALHTAKYIFGGGSEFDFTVLVPRDGESVDTAGLLKIVVPGEGLFGVEISKRTLHRQLHPADWVQAELTQSGCIARNQRLRKTPTGWNLYGSYQRPDGTAMRARTIQDGDDVFTIQVSANPVYFADWDTVASHVIASFRLLHPRGEKMVERLKRFSSCQPLEFDFQYLESWSVIPVLQDSDAVVLELNSEYAGRTTGQLRVEVHRKVAGIEPLALLRGYAKSLEELGVHLTGTPIVPRGSTHPAGEVYLYTPSAMLSGREYDCPVVVLDHDDYVALLALIGTAKKHSAEWWSINKYAFETLRDTFRVGAQCASRTTVTS